MLEVRDIKKGYGSVVALDGVTFGIGRGEVVGLLGPNGCGKTTTIKIICGILRKDGGSVLMGGTVLPTPEKQRSIGYMPQESALYQDQTVRENLQFFSELYGVPAGQFRTKSASLLTLVDLTEKIDTPVKALSGGMKHRLSMICAMVHDPDMLVLDEPTVGVDPELRASFWEYFAKIRSQGKTILISTHYMDEAANCSRVIMLRAGRVIADGPPQSILAETGCPCLEDAFMSLVGGCAQ